MLKSISVLFIAVFFGVTLLTLAFVVLASIVATLAALVYRLMPGPNVPLRYNLRNMLVRWKNTAVTAAAFIVVIAVLVFMLAFVNGMYTLTESSGRPGNVVVLKSGSNDEAFSDLPADADILKMSSEAQKNISVNKKGRALASKEVYIIVNQPIPNAKPDGKQNRFVQMRGIESAEISAEVHGLDLQTGRWFSETGLQKIERTSGTGQNQVDTRGIIALAGGAAAASVPDDRAIEVVLGAGIAREFSYDRPGGPLRCGELLDIGGRKWIVVGIMASGNSTFASELWCRDTLVQEQFGRRNSYSSYVVSTKDAKAAEKTAQDLRDFKELPVNALLETEYYAKLSANNKLFLYTILVVAIVMAVGGALGVMNTMFAAISQRAKDIGVLRLLGYTRWQILVSFLLESLVIAILGGIIGCALGYFADGLTATSIVTSGQGGGKSVILRLVVDAQTMAIGMLFAFVMGAVGGLVPALSAMRLKPLESLK